MQKRIILLILIAQLSLKANGQNYDFSLPYKIVISDMSFDSYVGRFEYKYEMEKDGNIYKLYRTHFIESNFKKEKKKTKRKFLNSIPMELISKLIFELNNPKDSLQVEDLGFSHEWFKENNEKVYNIAKRLWMERWPNSPDWNSYQIKYIKEQLKNTNNISEGVQRKFLNKGYITLHSSGGSQLRIDLIYKEGEISIESGGNYLGLPWIVGDKRYYNQNMSDIFYQVIPSNKGFNKKRLERRDQKVILEAIVDQIYKDDCERKVKSFAFYNYENEVNELRDKYKLWGFKEERSGTNNWDGEHRLFMYAKDTLEERNIRFGVNLTIEGNTLFTRDSIIKKADYYFELVNQIPFLLDYLDENPNRSLDIAFDNGNSLSKKVKEYQSGKNSWYDGICLNGKTEEYLNKCVAFVLRDEEGNGSNWLITPELDVVLIYYQHPKVYKYSDKELGLQGPSIRYACKHFELNGEIKK